MPHKKVDYSPWQISYLVQGLYKKEIIMDACRLGLVEPEDKVLVVKEKCDTWRMGGYFFEEIHPLHEKEKEFIEKYFKRRRELHYGKA